MKFEILIVYFALTLPVYQEEMLGVNERVALLYTIQHWGENAPRINGVMTNSWVTIRGCAAFPHIPCGAGTEAPHRLYTPGMSSPRSEKELEHSCDGIKVLGIGI